MLEQLNLLRNIGQFDSINPGAQLAFAALTLIYAENGRGKTTLSAVLRSLAIGDPALIQERRRLGAAHAPHVILHLGGARYTFQNGTWSANFPSLSVFDDAFVAANVCSGLEIGAEHRQNLHELILGAQGVVLNRELQRHVQAIEEHNRRLREKADAIPAAVRGNLGVDAFCELAEVENAAERIEETGRRLAAARSAEAIQQQAVFAPLELPEFDIDAIDEVLGRSLADLDASAARQVQRHIEKLGGGGEAWVAKGVELIPVTSQGENGEVCPFCLKGLEGSAIIEHYRAYFGAAYVELKSDTSDLQQSVESLHGGEVPAAFERAVRIASEGRQFWSAFTDVPEINIDTAAVARAWRRAREAVRAVLAAKQAAPLEPSALDAAAQEAIAAYRAEREAVISISASLVAVNGELAVIKEQAQTANVAALQSDLAQLKASESRHCADVAPLCQTYLDEKEAKAETERQRTTARVALDAYRQNIFPRYQDAINAYLQRFGAGFRLQGMASVNNRGGSAVNYAVLINQNQVPLTAAGAPCFRSALSSGDRNTLALAFFFASLDQDPGLADRIVVIDDPMTSLDEQRALVTVQEIRRLAGRVRQVIVLSHFKPFLLKVHEDAPRQLGRAAMLIRRGAACSEIAAWNITGDTVTEHDRRYARALSYLAAADPAIERQVASDLRPMLESYIRVVFPDVFPPGSLLGPFCNLCDQRVNSPDQILDAQDTQELRDLLDYANLFHHDTNPAWQTENINDQELASYAQRVVDFLRR